MKVLEHSMDNQKLLERFKRLRTTPMGFQFNPKLFKCLFKKNKNNKQTSPMTVIPSFEAARAVKIELEQSGDRPSNRRLRHLEEI